VLIASLQRVDDSEHLGGVAASAGGVGEDGANGLLRVDDEDRADSEGNALGVDVGRVLVVDPVSPIRSSPKRRRGDMKVSTHMSYASATFLSLSPMIGNLSLLPEISSMSLIQPPWLSIVFALRPMSLTPRLVNSGSSFAKAPSSVVHLWSLSGHGQLLPTHPFQDSHWRVIFWVREENDPTSSPSQRFHPPECWFHFVPVANVLVEVDWACGGLCLEVWRNGAEAERLWTF